MATISNFIKMYKYSSCKKHGCGIKDWELVSNIVSDSIRRCVCQVWIGTGWNSLEEVYRLVVDFPITCVLLKNNTLEFCSCNFILNSNIIINHRLKSRNDPIENNNFRRYCQNWRWKAEMETSKTVYIFQRRFTYLKCVPNTRKPACTSCFLLPIGLRTKVGRQTIVNVFNDFYRSSN